MLFCITKVCAALAFLKCLARQAKLSLLSCISTSSDYQLQELGLQLWLGNTYLQTQDAD